MFYCSKFHFMIKWSVFLLANNVSKSLSVLSMLMSFWGFSFKKPAILNFEYMFCRGLRNAVYIDLFSKRLIKY